MKKLILKKKSADNKKADFFPGGKELNDIFSDYHNVSHRNINVDKMSSVALSG